MFKRFQELRVLPPLNLDRSFLVFDHPFFVEFGWRPNPRPRLEPAPQARLGHPSGPVKLCCDWICGWSRAGRPDEPERLQASPRGCNAEATRCNRAGDTAWVPRCSAGRTAGSAGPRRRNAQLRWAMRGQDPLKEQRVPGSAGLLGDRTCEGGCHSPTRTNNPLSLHAANIMWNQTTSTVR